MPKFVTAASPDTQILVTIDQDGEDVNICLNDTIVAYLSGDDGKLWTMSLADDEVETFKASGIKFTESNEIQTA